MRELKEKVLDMLFIGEVDDEAGKITYKNNKPDYIIDWIPTFLEDVEEYGVDEIIKVYSDILKEGKVTASWNYMNKTSYYNGVRERLDYAITWKRDNNIGLLGIK